MNGGFSQEVTFLTLAASPPDVRRGYAPPVECVQSEGCALGSGSALKVSGQRPNGGQSPIS